MLESHQPAGDWSFSTLINAHQLGPFTTASAGAGSLWTGKTDSEGQKSKKKKNLSHAYFQ